jgi:hypothetical protein
MMGGSDLRGKNLEITRLCESRRFESRFWKFFGPLAQVKLHA